MKETIESFINNKEVAIAGVSSDTRKWGNYLLKELTKKGYTVYPVNPKLDEAEGSKCYRSVADLPGNIENLIIATSPGAISDIVRDCKGTSISRIWMPRNKGGSVSQSNEVMNIANENNIELVKELCPMMFLSQTGIHKFHFWIKKITKNLPAELQTEK